MLDEAVGPILESIRVGRTDILRTLLEEVRAEIDRGDSDRAEAALRFESFLNAPRQKGKSLLHEAVEHGNVDALRTLLHLGADPSVSRPDGARLADGCSQEVKGALLSCIFTAIAGSRSVLVRRLLASGVDANCAESGRSLLHWAASCADRATVEALLAAGADPNAEDESGATPMHEAVMRREEEVAAAIVRAGADINAQAAEGTFAGQSPLEMIRTCSDHHWSSDFLGILPIPNGVHSEERRSLRSETPVLSPTSMPDGIDNGGISLLDDGRETLLKQRNPSSSGGEKDMESLLLRASSPLAPVITDERLNYLWPQPTVIKQLQAEPVVFPKELQLSVSPGSDFPVHKIMDVFENSRHLFRAAGRRVYLNDRCPVGDRTPGADTDGTPASAATLCVVMRGGGGGGGGAPAATGAYSLHVGVSRRGERRVRICAGSMEGLRHALVTLAQLFRLFRRDDGLLPVFLSDVPHSSVRGLLVDMSPYGRVPKFEVLGQLVDLISTLKMNQLQAFFRLSKEGGWGFSHSKCQLLSLDRFCRERFVDLVPAFDVDGTVGRDNLVGLIPTIRDVQSCMSQTKYVHIGPVLSALLFKSGDKSGDDEKAAPDLAEMLFPRAEVMFICGNGLTGTAESATFEVPGLPMSAVVLHYGFHQSMGFTSALSRVQDSGHHVGICTGTGAWNNLSGSPDAMLASQVAAHRAMAGMGAPGAGVSIVAHFSSDPALAHSVFAWPGIVAAAGLAWNPDFDLEHLSGVMAELINHHVLGDEDSNWGSAIMELGRAEQILNKGAAVQESQQSTLLRLLVSPQQVRLEKDQLPKFATCMQSIRRVLSGLQRTPLIVGGGSDDDSSTPPPPAGSIDVHAEEIRHELHLTAELLLLAARLGRALLQGEKNEATLCSLEDLSPTFRTDFANKLLSLREQLRALWLTRYHPQGMQGSLAAMNALLARFIPEQQAEILHK